MVTISRQGERCWRLQFIKVSDGYGGALLVVWQAFGNRAILPNMIASHTDYRVDAETSSYLFDWSPFRVLNLSVSYRFGKRINMKHNKFGINTERL